MNFRELQYVLAIASEGSISKAADKLFISQPTLSRFLQTHESLLGAPIFQRVNGRMIPTYFGDRYLDYARQILKISDQMETELSDIAGQQKGRLVIAVPRHREDGIIILSIMKFREQFPNIELRVYEETSTKRQEMLLRGEVDLALLYPRKIDPSVTYEPMLQEQALLCVPPTSPLCEGYDFSSSVTPWIDLKKFAGQQFILQPENRIVGYLARNALRGAGIDPTPFQESTSLSGILFAVSRGHACGFLPDSYVHFSNVNPRPAIFSIGTPNSAFVLSAAYNTTAYHPRAMREYIKILKTVIEEQYR